MGESDFLAERRARRATETGDAALLRRAEAAEATVQTLEGHVASLQQRLRDAEEERRRIGELLDAERAQGTGRESELRRVKQREYAEQQLRVEAEDRLSGLERESRERDERLTRRVAAGEQDSGELGRRIEELRRQLSEAEQSAAAERAGLSRAEAELTARVAQLERRAEEIERGLQAERGARERAERELTAIRDGHRRMEGLLGEIRALVKRLAAVLGGLRSPEPPARPAVPTPPAAPRRAEERSGASAGQQRGLEMAEALAAAVERLRERALSAPPLPEDPGGPPPPRVAHTEPLPASPRTSPGARAPLPTDPGAPQVSPAARSPLPPPVQPPPAQPNAAPLAADAEQPAATAAEPSRKPDLLPQAQGLAPSYEVPLPLPGQPAPQRPAQDAGKRPRHKHSQSLLRRIRNRRKERRGG
jgi:predicted  nucleic acid-binding Zn-ribbon protein